MYIQAVLAVYSWGEVYSVYPSTMNSSELSKPESVAPVHSTAAPKIVKISLLRSMESICVAPGLPSVSSLQMSFLGQIYRHQGEDVKERAGREAQDMERKEN